MIILDKTTTTFMFLQGLVCVPQYVVTMSSDLNSDIVIDN